MDIIEMETKKTGKIREWIRRNKKKVILGIGAVIGLTTLVLLTGKNTKENEDDISSEPTPEFDYGRDLDMQFVVPETGEVLGKIGCTESYMKDMMDCE